VIKSRRFFLLLPKGLEYGLVTSKGLRLPKHGRLVCFGYIMCHGEIGIIIVIINIPTLMLVGKGRS
jgi:hypothetical protein